ncbi:MAG: hypothetical protein Q9227_007003 [Pyrenula ochraceoflavens]
MPLSLMHSRWLYVGPEDSQEGWEMAWELRDLSEAELCRRRELAFDRGHGDVYRERGGYFMLWIVLAVTDQHVRLSSMHQMASTRAFSRIFAEFQSVWAERATVEEQQESRAHCDPRSGTKRRGGCTASTPTTPSDSAAAQLVNDDVPQQPTDPSQPILRPATQPGVQASASFVDDDNTGPPSTGSTPGSKRQRKPRRKNDSQPCESALTSTGRQRKQEATMKDRAEEKTTKEAARKATATATATAVREVERSAKRLRRESSHISPAMESRDRLWLLISAGRPTVKTMRRTERERRAKNGIAFSGCGILLQGGEV